jgi:pimeloyl-ACP methyl ester carboxylesterase
MNITARIAFGFLALQLCCLANAAEGTFESNGVRIHYVDEGKGIPVLLLHGQGSSVEMQWRATRFFEKLVPDYRIVALDLRGHGKSGKPHETEAYGDEMGLDAIRLMDHLGIKKAHVVGYSLGGFLASILIAKHPDRFISATLGGSGARTAYSEEARARDEREAGEREKECISRSFIAMLAGPDTPKPSEEELRKRSQDCMANPNEDRFASAAIVRARRLQVVAAEEVAKTKVPTLAIVGTHDPLRRAAENLQEMRPDVKIVYIEGAVHSTLSPKGTLRQPEFVNALREFLASH